MATPNNQAQQKRPNPAPSDADRDQVALPDPKLRRNPYDMDVQEGQERVELDPAGPDASDEPPRNPKDSQ